MSTCIVQRWGKKTLHREGRQFALVSHQELGAEGRRRSWGKSCWHESTAGEKQYGTLGMVSLGNWVWALFLCSQEAVLPGRLVVAVVCCNVSGLLQPLQALYLVFGFKEVQICLKAYNFSIQTMVRFWARYILNPKVTSINSSEISGSWLFSPELFCILLVSSYRNFSTMWFFKEKSLWWRNTQKSTQFLCRVLWGTPLQENKNVVPEWNDSSPMGLNTLPSVLPACFSCEWMFGMSTPFHRPVESPHGVTTRGIYSLLLTSMPRSL